MEFPRAAFNVRQQPLRLRGCLASRRVKSQTYAACGIPRDAARLVSDYEARRARALKAGR